MRTTFLILPGILVAFLIITLSFTSNAVAEEQAPPKEDKKIELKIIEDDFEYEIEGRPDPFEPFLKPKVITSLDPNEIIDSDEELTGMQLFEPGQLTLVAIMQRDGKNIAMVQDSTGKGYVLSAGMKIGKRGVIKAIDSNKVMIEETAVTRAKKVIKTKIDMVLNKEGEE